MGKKFLILVILSSVIFTPLSALALPVLPSGYGGKILAIIPCTCTPNTNLIAVGPPKGGLFLQTPATRGYRNYLLSPGKWILGLTVGVSVPCMVGTPPACVSSGSGKLIQKFGVN